MTRLLALTAFAILWLAPSAEAKNSYGGYNIAGEKKISEQPYAEVRGWKVLSAKAGNSFAYCTGEKEEGGAIWRLGYDAQQWQLGVPVGSRNPYEGSLEVDGDVRPASGESTPKWTFAWLTLEDLDRLSKGKQMILEVGKASLDFALDGTAAVAKKVEECVARKGVVATAAPATPAKAKPPIKVKAPVENDAYRMEKGCPRLGTAYSDKTGSPATATFTNKTTGDDAMSVLVYKLKADGHPEETDVILEPGQSTTIKTQTGSVYVMKDSSFSCRGGVFEVKAGKNTFIGK